MTRVRFSDLRVSAGGARLLDGVTGEVASGTVTAVVGPSGAGKSTLLGVVAGLRTAEAGRVWLDDDDVTAQPPERRGLGVVFQDLRLFPFLTARENVAFGPRAQGLPGGEIRARVDEALERVHASRFADRSVRELSGGERQRVAVARALAVRPRALLLDEPFGALDAELRRDLRDELRGLIREARLTTILVTHDREDAFALASDLLVLHEGRLEQRGTVEECYARPASAFVATLLGEAALLPVERREGRRALVAGAWIEVEGEGARVVLRPEALAASAGSVDVEGAGEWRGTVVDARFAGGEWRVVVDVPGAGLLVARLPAPPAGGEIRLSPRRALPTF